MKCQHPLDVSIKSGSEVYRVGKYPFQGRASFLVPCGKCLACKSRRKSETVFRMDAERRHGHLLKDGTIKKYRYCFFVTLTYAERFLPRFVPTALDERTGEVYSYKEVAPSHTGLLNPYHFKEFMKRLRRYYSLDCKVFGCGEYGDEGNRPHIHLILYSDLDWLATKNACRHAWSMKCPPELKNTPGSFVVEGGKYRTWRFVFGRVDVKPVNIRRMRYCAKYVLKDENLEHEIPTFSRISHFLGSGWLLSHEARSVRSGRRLFAFSIDGKPSSLGRYFTHRIFKKEELKECIDSYLKEFETPPEGCEVGEKFKCWHDEHIANNNALFRASLVRNYLPRLSYV